VALSISSIAVSANFEQSNSCGSSLAAGANCSIIVLFDPSTAGTVSGAVTIADNSSTSTQTITLTGTATAPQYNVTVAWTASTTSGVTGYDVYRSTSSGSGYTMLNSSPVTTTSYADSTVAAGATYYYVTTAVNSSGVQSSYSNQATAVVP
jgi:fibronectin type 3 domain-containing protein